MSSLGPDPPHCHVLALWLGPGTPRPRGRLPVLEDVGGNRTRLRERLHAWILAPHASPCHPYRYRPVCQVMRWRPREAKPRPQSHTASERRRSQGLPLSVTCFVALSLDLEAGTILLLARAGVSMGQFSAGSRRVWLYTGFCHELSGKARLFPYPLRISRNG